MRTMLITISLTEQPDGTWAGEETLTFGDRYAERRISMTAVQAKARRNAIASDYRATLQALRAAEGGAVRTDLDARLASAPAQEP